MLAGVRVASRGWGLAARPGVASIKRLSSRQVTPPTAGYSSTGGTCASSCPPRSRRSWLAAEAPDARVTIAAAARGQRNHLGAGQRRRSDDAGVIAERGHREAQLRTRVQHPRTRRLEDPVGEVLAQRLGHRAADHHQRDVEQVHRRPHPDSDGIKGSVEQLSGQFVPVVKGTSPDLRGRPRPSGGQSLPSSASPHTPRHSPVDHTNTTRHRRARSRGRSHRPSRTNRRTDDRAG